MNISFNFLNTSMGILLCLKFELFKWILKLSFHFSFHSCLFDFNVVLLFLDCLLQTDTILLPSHKLKFILKFLFTNRLHLILILIHFRDLDINILNLFTCFFLHAFNFSLIRLNSFILCLFILLFKGLYLIFKFYLLFHCLIIITSKPQYNIFFVFELLFVTILKVIYLWMSILQETWIY